MTDKFASHTLRVLLVVLSGRPLVDAQTTSLLQSKKKEKIKVSSLNKVPSPVSSATRTVPASFSTTLDRMMKGTVAGLSSTNLRALASHPVANPLLQLLLDLEFRQSGRSKAKDIHSLFRKLLPDDLPEEGSGSASFFNGMLYDPIGSRLLEVLVTNSPGKTFKILYQNLFRSRLPTLAKNETASYVLVKALERLNRENLQEAIDELSAQMRVLVDRSRTSVIRCLIQRCQVRGVDMHPLAVALLDAYGGQPEDMLRKMLHIDLAEDMTVSDERRKHSENQNSTKAHSCLLAQSMLEAPGPLRELITQGIVAMDNPTILHMANDRIVTHVLQMSITCSGDTARFRRTIMPRLTALTLDLSTDPVGSRVVDAFWTGSDGLSFIREKIAEILLKHESLLRGSIPGRAVWRNWKMDTYKTTRLDWLSEAKVRTGGTKTGIELARERFAARKQNSSKGSRRQQNKTPSRTGANAVQVVDQG